jgi:5'(3')-deoxyribonucleotidase
MDGVLVDFQSGINKLSPKVVKENKDDLDDVDGIFSLMDPMPKAIEAAEFLAKHFDLYILSTAPWANPSAWKDKLLWIKKYLPEVCHKRLILSHNKHLNAGDYLIDDNKKNGADKFKGEHIHFKQGKFKNWDDVLAYLCTKENIALTGWK